MTNDSYLVVSYVVCAVFSMVLGTLVYLSLRRPFADVADAARSLDIEEALARWIAFPSSARLCFCFLSKLQPANVCKNR